MSKCLLMCHIIEAIFRNILHIFLILEVSNDIFRIEMIKFESITGSIVELIIICCFLDIVFSNLIGGHLKDPIVLNKLNRDLRQLCVKKVKRQELDGVLPTTHTDYPT